MIGRPIITPPRPVEPGPDRMLYVYGSSVSFRCEGCGSNIFRKRADKEDGYRCNGCGETYTVE